MSEYTPVLGKYVRVVHEGFVKHSNGAFLLISNAAGTSTLEVDLGADTFVSVEKALSPIPTAENTVLFVNAVAWQRGSSHWHSVDNETLTDEDMRLYANEMGFEVLR